MRRIAFITLLAMIFMNACSRQPTPLTTPTVIPTPYPNTLYIDPNTSLGEISPLVYGSNYGPWAVLSVDGLEPAYNSGLKILRFPGGNWGDRNDVQTYQIDQFMGLLGKMGATAMINVRLLGGTPEQAAEMVRYVNLEKKYNVLYWGIGNEPTLYDGELKNKGGSYDSDRFNKEWRAIAEAMKKVDAAIKLVGPESHQFSYDFSGASTNFTEANELWMEDFLKANGDLVDIVSFHRYPFPRSRISGPASIDELRINTREWDKIIVHLREIIHKNTGRDLPIAITEFNSDYIGPSGGVSTPDSHYNAIWLGDVLGKMIKNGVFMADQWMLTSTAGLGNLGLIGRGKVYPSYYTYQMYKMFAEELIYSSSDNPDLSIYSARRKDGALTIMVINLSLEEQAETLRIAGKSSLKGQAWLFDPTHNAENIGAVELSGEVKFPAQSMLLLIVK
jgi:Glycosyl hydrolases family 39